MKTKQFIKNLVCLLVINSGICVAPLNAQNIGINATGATPNVKAMLDIDVSGLTPKTGLLVPRMTTAERNAITAPIPESLLIYNTTTQCFEAWNQSAAVWVPFGCIGCTTPLAPVAAAATSATVSAFTANWGSVPGAASYVLDVSTSSTFTSYVSGYNSLNVGNTLTSTISSLTCAATYYYRVSATNACGTSVSSNTITVTTAPCTPVGISCGTQVWAAANLNVGTATTAYQTNNGVVEKYCYNNVPANCATYGGQYSWDEAMAYNASVNCDPCGSSGVRGICPTGYHIPTDLEWSRYEYCVESTIAPTGTLSLLDFQTTGGVRGTGSKIKASNPAWNGTNLSGFNALPGGVTDNNPSPFSSGIGDWAYYWTATEDIAPANALHRLIYTGYVGVARSNTSKNRYLMSIRCLQD